jgi:predicted dehydrogenase
MKKLTWGVISTAKIGREKVIPPMKVGQRTTVLGIASREQASADRWARELGLAKAYPSYAAILEDPAIEAIYNPLPNHLHVEWTTRAAEAGKHVLCEKPIGITMAAAEELIRVRDRTGVKIQEGFMVRTHPQWLKVRELVQGGRVGTLKAISGFFSYFLTDPTNVRNQADIGGGGLLDIGCYPINTSRFVTGLEPRRVAAVIDHDPVMRVDRLGTTILDFDGVQCAFTWSTQLNPRQTMQFVGDKGRLEVEIPFNAPNDRPCRLFVYDDAEQGAHVAETIEIPTCDQYGIAGDAFSAAIMDGTEQPVPLEDSLLNMRVLDAVRRAGASGSWEKP